MGICRRHHWTSILSASALGAALFVSGCTVTPLESANGVTHQKSAAFTDVALAEPSDRLAQQVYQALIELGANPRGEGGYLFENSVKSSLTNSAIRRGTSASTIGQVTLTSSWTLRRRADNEVMGSGTTSADASFDYFEQEMANQQAKREAEGRAAQQLALRLRPIILRAKTIASN